MQRPAICCEQMRLSVEPRSSRLSLPARHLSYGKVRPPIQEFLKRMIATNATNSCCPRGTRPRALAPREGIDAAPNACVYLPVLLADKMCKDATCISDCMH
jgi:hypothetical protein